jgi:DNA-binding GntR family transcriptional regulator
MGSYLRHYPARASIWDEHQAILDAVIAGNAEAAETSARRHADQALANLIPLLARDAQAPSGKGGKKAKRRI